MKRTIKILTLLLIINFIPQVNALTACTPSTEWLIWNSLSETEKEVSKEPFYCAGSYNSTNNVENIEKSYTFNTTSDGNISYAASYDSYYNAVDDGLVTSVKNQKQTGTCWSFASASLLESLAIKYNFVSPITDTNSNNKIESSEDTIDISEMHIVYGTSYDAFEDEADYGKLGKTFYLESDTSKAGEYNRTFENGGNTFMSYSYGLSKYGIVNESVLSFSDATKSSTSGIINKPIEYSSYDQDSKLFNINDYIEGDGSDDYVNNLKERILQYGSAEISIDVDYTYSTFKDSTTGVWYHANLSSTPSTNHSITVVGWDDTIPASSFTTSKCLYYTYSFDSSGNYTVNENVESCSVKTDGAWIVKNSWGSSWSKNGFFYVSYESTDVKNYNTNFVGLDTNTYDYHNYNSSMYSNPRFYVNADTTTYNAVLFEKNIDKEVLKKVTIPTVADVNYTIYYAEQNGDEWKNKENWIKIASNVEAKYYGNKSVILDEPVLIENDYAIIVEANYSGTNDVYYIPVTSKYNSDYSGTKYNEIKENQSFGYDETDDSWFDFYTYYTINYTEEQMEKYGDLTAKLGYVIYTYTDEYHEDVTSTKYNVDIYDIKIDADSQTLTKDSFESNISTTLTYEILNSNDEVISPTNIGTGMKLHFIDDDITFDVILMGDTSGDGKINYLDYVNVYNHIKKVKNPDSTKKLLVDDFLLAADMSGDDKISYLDYVKIYNKIKSLKGGTN